MKSSRVYIKSNYIKKAKIDWVYCDAQILKHNNISLLKLSSVNGSNDDKDDTQSRISNFSNVSTVYRSKLTQSIGLKVLCNLSEFKSSEIKPVNFYNTEKFAIKLVPSGILNSKKLFMVPEHEEDLTKWCSLLGEYIYKNKECDTRTLKTVDTKENESTLRKESKSDKTDNLKINDHMKNETENLDEVSTLTKKSEVLDHSKYNDENCSMIPNSPMSFLSNKSEEIYFAMDDNEVYETTSSDNIYTVCVEESDDSKKIGIKGSYIMKLKPDGIDLCDLKRSEVLHEFPYIFIRRFGAKNDLLRLEAGRKCSTGEGYFIFRFKDAGKAVVTIKELVKELKASCVKNPDSEFDESRSARNSMSLSMNSSTFECNIDTNLKKDNQPKFSSQNSINTICSPVNTVVKPVSTQTLNVENLQPTYSQPQVLQKKPLHPLYNSVSSVPNGRNSPTVSVVTNPVSNQYTPSPTSSRLPVINNAFNRNQYAASFSYRRPAQVNIPIIKDDSCSRSAIYDNIPTYEQKPPQIGSYSAQNSPPRTMHNQPSNLKFTSSYNLNRPLANTVNGQYDNVPNNQRCIKELETMLMDLGITTN